MNFLELKALYRSNYLSDLLLFNNKEVKIDGNSIFYSIWLEKAVLSIQDLLDCNGKFLSFQTFQQRYNIKCNFLNYLQVLSAIHIQYKIEISVVFISTAAKVWGEKEMCTKGVCYRQKEGEGRRNYAGLRLLFFWETHFESEMSNFQLVCNCPLHLKGFFRREGAGDS